MCLASPRALLVALATASLLGCFIPDDYDPCHGACPDAQYWDGSTSREVGLADAGPALAAALGPTVTSEPPPPPLAGGTLLALRGGLALLADPDGDSIRVVDPRVPAQIGQLVLDAHDEPGRAVEDAAGRVHVVLRGAGAVVSLDLADPSAPSVLARRAVCPVPRGIAYDAALDVIYVVCMGGELATLPPLGDPLRSAQLPDDLRDVVVDGTQLWITRFRSAEVLAVDPASATLLRTTRPSTVTSALHPHAPAVAWRALAAPHGGVLVLHQIARADAVPREGDARDVVTCDEAWVQSRVTRVRGSTTLGATLSCAVLAIDAAIAPDASALTVALAGAAPLDPCHPFATIALGADGTPGPSRSLACTPVAGRVVAVAYASDGSLLAQTRSPLGLVVSSAGVTRDLQLPGALARDSGLDVFHSAAAAHLACASCHPEGGDDGRVWLFDDAAHPRRTIPLRGGIVSTTPLDWDGRYASFDTLLGDVLDHQLGAGRLAPSDAWATSRWVDAIAPLPVRTIDDAAAVARGQLLFESARLACATCHAGPALSDESSRDLGTGGTFQVPSLRGVGYRAPYFHDGCATTLDEALRVCGGAVHATSGASSAERADLVAYLATL